VTKSIRIPGQIRRHVLKNVKPRTQGERDLMAACVEGAKYLEANEMSSLNTVDLNVTNDALGVTLRIARDWLDSDNGNDVMAGKSMLKFELEYEPDDPREIRHEIKLPKSLATSFDAPYTREFKNSKRIPAAVKADMKGMSWTSTGAAGKVRAEGLGWFLDRMNGLKDNPHPATSRAAKKFTATYADPYEKTMRLINGYLGTGEDEDQAPELPAVDFMAALHGQAPEKPEVAPKQKRLVIIACGGKKSDAPGLMPAEERYTGNYFQACRMAAEVMDGPTMVLSAKYGLIPLHEEIENYNVRLGDKDSIRLGFLKQQVEELGLGDAKVTVLGGEKYVKGVRQVWPDAEAPLKGGIGQQLKQLAGMYEGEALADDEHQDQEPEEEPAGPYPHEWKSGALRDIPNLPGRYNPADKAVWFGGKAGKANPEPSNWRKVKVTYTGEGKYDINDAKTGVTVMTCTLVSKVHWAPGRSVKEFDEWQKANRPEEVSPEAEEIQAAMEAAPAGGYEVPVNWLELAEEGNTDAAKRYWKRRCEEYRRTGK
jgi:hypothetical protein